MSQKKESLFSKVYSIMQKHPVGFLSLTGWVLLLIVSYNFVYGILKNSIGSIAQNAGAIIQTITSQGTQNPEYIQLYGDQSLLGIIFTDPIIQKSLWSLFGLYIGILLFATVFITALIYFPLYYYSHITKTKIVSFSKLIKLIIVWMSIFALYKIIFLFLNLRYVFVSVITETTPFNIFIIDRIVVFLFVVFLTISVMNLYTMSVKKAFFQSFKPTKTTGVTILVLLVTIFFIILLFMVFELIPSVAMLILLLIVFSAIYIGYTVFFFFYVKHEYVKKHHPINLKKFVYLPALFFILFLPLLFATSYLESQLTPLTGDFDFELPSNYKEQLRLSQESIYIIEFIDFNCQFCKSSHPLVLQLRDIYKNEQKVQFETRHFLLDELNEGSIRAGMTYECLKNQGLALQAKETLYEYQNQFSVNTLLNIGEMSENYGQFVACFESESIYNIVQSDTINAKNMGLQGTPTYLVFDTTKPQDAKIFVGTPPIQVMVATIDEWI